MATQTLCETYTRQLVAWQVKQPLAEDKLPRYDIPTGALRVLLEDNVGRPPSRDVVVGALYALRVADTKPGPSRTYWRLAGLAGASAEPR